MGVSIRQKIKGNGNPYWIFIALFGHRKSIKVGTKEEAETLATEIRIKMGGQKAEEIIERVNDHKWWEKEFQRAINKSAMEIIDELSIQIRQLQKENKKLREKFKRAHIAPTHRETPKIKGKASD